MEAWKAEVAIAAPSDLGESPWWDAARERLIWVDIPNALVRAHTPATGSTSEHRLEDPVGFVVGRDGGGYLAGTGTGLVALDPDLRPSSVLAVPEDLDGQRRMNDGACDSAGRVLFGTIDPSGTRTGTLWSLAPNGAPRALVDGVRLSNGLGFSPDGRRLYYVDTPTQRVDTFTYDVASGRVVDRRMLCEIPASAGLPDGLAVDVEGCLWLALWGGAAVWRLTPDGEPIGVVRVGASRTTSCAFGGSGRDRLYVTTARNDGDDGEAARGGAPGALFVADVGVRGAPVFEAAV